MTKANESPSPTQTSPEPDWEAGVRRTTQEGRLLALGPAPVDPVPCPGGSRRRVGGRQLWNATNTRGLVGFPERLLVVRRLFFLIVLDLDFFFHCFLRVCFYVRSGAGPIGRAPV